ncbi:glutamate mutase L [candidate division WOR-3 bacterium]|nr:glutamate mutase L [candidate division WOR-3 bacterium]
MDEIKTILATDCGSTTTKAILIEKQGEEYRLVVRGEAPTTVEAPFEDVTRGVLNSIMEIEELTGKKILDGEKIIKPRKSDTEGVDIYISTSSAGGGLQMMVAGVVKSMTVESAARAALGAGAIVMEAIASNDGRLPHQRIELMRQLRPDMILLAGGIDGGTVSHVVELSQLIGAAEPKARFGTSFLLPVIYAGNKDAQNEVKDILEKKTALSVVDNIRPVLEREELGPARNEIHELFLEHVMAHAPGYKKLIEWTDTPIMPTPGAVGSLVEMVGKTQQIDVMGVDMGGATTDIFSVFKGVFNRTVSANLGMSYSISNVMAEAGVDNIMRWIPFELPEVDLRNRIRNKMVRPTTIPSSLEDLKIEQAIAREAMRLAFEHHQSMAVGLKGVQQRRTISDTFAQKTTGQSLIDMMSLNLVIGSGGGISHAPKRMQAALMLIDAWLPEGVTRIAVDSIFMMPHLGVLATVHEKAAMEVFEKDCLVKLGTCIAPVGTSKEGRPCVEVKIKGESRKVNFGDIVYIPFEGKEEAQMIPEKGFDIGEGRGKEVIKEIEGGEVGIIIDARGRPFKLPEDQKERIERLNKWLTALEVY